MENNNFRIGFAKDIHVVKKTRKPNTISLGGYKFSSNHEIIAHSDGDVIIHAIVDALLSACNLEDIGYYFSNKDPKNKNIDSKEILKFSLEKLNELNLKPIQINLTIISNDFMISKIKQDIINELNTMIKDTEINIKGKSFEKRNNTIECYCFLSLTNK